MQTQMNVRQGKTLWSNLCQYSRLLLFSLVLTACSQDSDSQQGVISDDKLSAPLPKAIIARSVDGFTLIVDLVVNGDTDNLLRLENLDVNIPAGTFSGDVSAVPTGTSTLSLVYSINDPAQGIVEVIRTSDITVTVVANEDTLADFSSAEMTYTDTDEDSFSNLDELKTGTDIKKPNYTVGGRVVGLIKGNQLTLQNNGKDGLLINEGNTFNFSPTAITGDTYNVSVVSVLTQLGNPDQTCTIINGSGKGTVGNAAVSSVNVTCDIIPSLEELTPAASPGGLDIAANSPPFFTVGSTISVAEDTTVTGYTATAQDPDDDTVTFSLSGGTDQEVLSIDSDSGVLSFKILTRFKHPSDSDGNNTYVVEITATDGIHSIVKSVTVTVTIAILEVSVSTADIKTIRFEWPAYVDATSYRLLVNSDGASGFSELQDDLSETSTIITLPIHLTDWINARYILEAHGTSGKLTESSPVSITALKLSSIGYFKASNTDSNDEFGWAMSLSGDGNTLAVGARLEDSIATGVSNSGENDNTATDSGAIYVFSRDGNLWVQQAYIKATNTEANDQFGSAVSLSSDGNTLVVGASLEDSAATGINIDGNGEDDNTAENAGAVYVFSRSGVTWNRQAYIKASNTGEGDQFGSVVSLSGDGNTLVVGASEEDSIATGISSDDSSEDDNTASNSGAVYVFSRNGTTWVQQAYVKANTIGGDDRFGNAVSLSEDGNMLAVGASEEDSVATGISNDGSGESDNTAGNSGAVYVFSRNGTTWSQQVYVKASNTGTGDSFGQTVSLSGDGNMLVVGASGEGSAFTGISTDGSGEDDNTANRSGAVYIFGYGGGVWSQQAYVKASNTEAADLFGSAVSLSGDGNTLAVGAQQKGNSSSGAVYVFSHNGGIWSQQPYVKASTIEAADRFGYAISLSSDGNMLAAGAFREDSATTGISTGGSDADNSANRAGAVYLY